MSETELENQTRQMLDAALGGLTPHEALIQASREEAARGEERAAAIIKNRERAQRLLAALEKSLG